MSTDKKPKTRPIPLTEHFSLAEITWKIQNISIALCPLTQEIFSEEFEIEGREVTLWRMTLKISREQEIAALYLTLLGPDKDFFSPHRQGTDLDLYGLVVNCYANILDANGEHSLKSEKSFMFHFRSSEEIETFDLTEIIHNLPHTGPDDLTFKCYILINQGLRVNVPCDVPYGLIELSKTFEKLVKDPLHPDIKVLVNKRVFLLHREMFSNMFAMKKFMRGAYKEAKLLNHCEHSLESIFYYAYSGNINYIISSPSIRVAEDIDRLKVPDLSKAYPKLIIPLESKIQVREHNYAWEIKNFELIEESLDSPEFNVDGTNTRWKICIHPTGKVNGNVQEKNYVFLEAILIESNRSIIDVNIEFCSLNENEIIYSRRDYKRMKIGDKIEIPFFLRGGVLLKKCLTDGNLSLRITLNICTGKIIAGIRDIIRPEPFVQTNSVSMNFFSRKLRNILADQKNCNLILKNDNLLFSVHKYVLASRSTYFRVRMSNHPNQILTIPEYKKHFFRVFLEYLYTGLYCDMEFEANCHYFEFGCLYEIKPLRDYCRQGFDFYTLLRYLEYATDNNLRKLRNETFQHIVNIGQAINEHPDWSDFFTRRSDLAFAIISYWK